MNDILVSAQCFSISSCSLRFHCPCTWWGWWWCRVPVVALSMAMVPVSRECPCQLPAADHCAHCHQPDYLPAQSSHWSSHCTLSLIGFCSALIGCFHTGRHYVLMWHFKHLYDLVGLVVTSYYSWISLYFRDALFGGMGSRLAVADNFPTPYTSVKSFLESLSISSSFPHQILESSRWNILVSNFRRNISKYLLL